MINLKLHYNLTVTIYRTVVVDNIHKNNYSAN